MHTGVCVCVCVCSKAIRFEVYIHNYGISEKKCNIPLEFHTGSMEWKANFPFPIPHTTGNPLWPGMLSVEWKSSFPFHTPGIVIRMYIRIPAWKAQSWNTVES